MGYGNARHGVEVCPPAVRRGACAEGAPECAADQSVIPLATLEDHAVLSLAEAGGGVEDRLEDGVQVDRRGRDDPQHLCRRGLLLQRLGDLTVALTQLLEEAGVLDRDDRLV